MSQSRLFIQASDKLTHTEMTKSSPLGKINNCIVQYVSSIKFGGPDHMRRCNFFRWDSPNENENDVNEQSFLARNRNEIPYVSNVILLVNLDRVQFGKFYLKIVK
ncbi:18136_t:CDS:2 [Funneliformis geosporum]|uniref:9051_t:CDS:1 n=1 Tax=Funneliformis geosporum TaxID=1117311 RepID=A0A9W4SN65_9GLOM|nr:9051_t:CDS:2 [Funneliformis geosporum]CAI2177537.1 18136_t:CDS:2 [Funneliformis geosporum]